MRPLPNLEPNTAACVMYEWHCITEQDRIFIWSAISMQTCIARMMEAGHRLKFIMELSEYERMQADEQRVLNSEHDITDRTPAVA